MTSTPNPATFPNSVQPTLRLPLLIALGIAFWFLAAMMIRFIGPFVFVEGSVTLVLTFVFSVPIAWAFVWIGTTLTGNRGAAVLPAVVVMTSVAMLLDGVALTWFPSLYGSTFAFGGAWLLWGVGLTQTIALLHTQRRQ